MKTQDIIWIGGMLMLLVTQSCRTRTVDSEKNRTKLEQKEEVRVNSLQSELLTGNRVVQLTDSSSKFFRVTIFPFDTVSFSLEDGFKGRATKIEVVGAEKNFQRVSDSVDITGSTNSTVRYKRENESNEKEITASKDIKSRPSGWLVVVLCLSVVTVVGYFFYWVRRQGTNITL